MLATTVIDGVRDTINEFPPTNGATDASTDEPPEPISTPHKPLDNVTSPSDSNPPEQIVSNNRTTSTMEISAISATPSSDRSIGGPSLDEQSPPAELGVAVNTEATTNSPPLEVDASVERSVLDASGASLERVLASLKTQDTDRIDNSTLLGEYGLLANTDPIAGTRIVTSIGMNCVNSVFLSLASALEIEKRRLQERERSRLKQISEGRKQMALYSTARTMKEAEYRQEEERLPKETEAAIARLSVREIAERELTTMLSEPAELTGEFSEQKDFDNLIREVDNQNASEVTMRGRVSVKETYYWPIIQRLAAAAGPAPNSPGRKTQITPQEKDTARRLVIALGYGHSRDSILKARSYLKLLSDLREAGVTLLLLYRTKEFRTHFLRHPNELTAVLSWNQVYHPLLQELRLRAITQADGDFSGRCDLEDPDIFRRLHIPQGVTWGDHISDWRDTGEKDKYLASHSIMAVSGKSNAHVLQHGIKGDINANKAIYVGLIPYEGISAKKTLGGRSPSAKLLAASPLVSISPGDFLGIFPGKLRYTDVHPAGAIEGPAQGLWLDRSEVKGKLHWMKVAKAGEQTNVCLAWEGVNEVKGEKTFCQYWRILVVATRHIGPFDQLTRPA